MASKWIRDLMLLYFLWLNYSSQILNCLHFNVSCLHWTTEIKIHVSTFQFWKNLKFPCFYPNAIHQIKCIYLICSSVYKYIEKISKWIKLLLKMEPLDDDSVLRMFLGELKLICWIVSIHQFLPLTLEVLCYYFFEVDGLTNKWCSGDVQITFWVVPYFMYNFDDHEYQKLYISKC